jgi:uncharacterized protein (TIGR03084 family)
VDVTTLQDVMNDLRAETAHLDDILAPLDDAGWATPTPAEGWDIRDTIGHLASTDDIMFESVTRTANPKRVLPESATSIDDFTALHVAEARAMTPSDVYAWWRSATARLHETIEGFDPARKYPWGGNMLSPLSLASARIMETWAHALDCYAAVGRDYPDTDRIRHIAFLGLRALPHAFGLVGLEPPGSVRLELEAPDGSTWNLGPADARSVISGTAGDWCRVVVHRDRDGSAKRLYGEGPDAANAITHARAFL